ncbi:hypothetical protein I3843_15G096800 [Carya illinoinensis]|nr:hypothetical protein I3843_15G096800 [Carya illinoinensis]
MENPFGAFFSGSMTYFLRVFSKFNLHLIPWPSQPSTNQVVDLEAGVPPAVGLVAKIFLPFCLTTAIDVALVYVQVHSKLSTIFHCLNMAILLAFSSFSVGGFINPKYVLTTKVAVNCGVFFTYTAFFIGITIPLPSSLKATSWLICVISLLTVLLSFKTKFKEFYDQAKRLNTRSTGDQ